MKIQHLAIVFVIIILPISMVLSYYTGSQIKTIKQQQNYDSKLLTATYDAIRSFQLNTLNNKYSSLSDSKIRDIEAAISTFYDSLGTELGSSGYREETLSDYIPAILFTMYDGYYIYGKYYNEASKVLQYNEDGSIKLNPVTNQPEYSFGDYQYGLRPYVYYSCRYKNNHSDFIVNYTLDNTITVYGKVGGEYVTKSGALINPGLIDVNSITTKTNNAPNGEVYPSYYSSIKYGDIIIEEEVLKEQLITLVPASDDFIQDANGNMIYMDKDGYFVLNEYNEKVYITDNDIISYLQSKLADRGVFAERETYEYVNYNNRKIYMDKSGYFWNNKNKKQYITDEKTLEYVKSRTSSIDGHLYSNSAVEYFYNAYQFSKWVMESDMKNITQENAIDLNGEEIEFATKTGNEPIFRFDNNNNPLLEDSTFNENRIDVIRKSIETNLSAAIANFGAGADYEYVMPEFSEEDWYKIENNISVASFMQGLPIGSKFFNDYCVITNDKNKEFIAQDSIYMIVQGNDGNEETHYPGCYDIDDDKIQGAVGYNNVDFERQTVVVSEGNENYYYPHAEQKSYNCMVNITKSYELDDLISGVVPKYTKIRKAYLTALAREKYDLYKTNNYFGN